MVEYDEGKEPQSHSADKGWGSGKTGGTVDNQSQKSEGGDDAFYNPRRDKETSADFQGGRISPEQLAENAASVRRLGPAQRGGSSAENVSRQSGAQRDSIFASGITKRSNAPPGQTL